MNFFTFLFLTVLVGCSIPLLKIWQDGRKARPMDDANANAMRRQIDALAGARGGPREDRHR